jgi:hypothetical protein
MTQTVRVSSRLARRPAWQRTSQKADQRRSHDHQCRPIQCICAGIDGEAAGSWPSLRIRTGIDSHGRYKNRPRHRRWHTVLLPTVSSTTAGANNEDAALAEDA